MAKEKLNVRSVYEIAPYLKKDNQLAVYFISGSDGFTIDSAIKAVENAFKDLISSDFDKEIINCDKNISMASIIDNAYAFPFGSGKKILIIKDFDKINDKKGLLKYLENPSDSTIMIIANPVKVTSFASEPYATMIKKDFLFEAEELKGDLLVKWVISHSSRNSLKISRENAIVLVDIVGEDKSLLEMHIRKFYDYLGSGKEITLDVISNLSSFTREYNYFDYQDAISTGDITKALFLGNALVEQGVEPVYFLSMLNKFFLILNRSFELRKLRDDNEEARALSVSWYYYKKIKSCTYFNSEKKMREAFNILLDADVTVKSTTFDNKTFISTLTVNLLS